MKIQKKQVFLCDKCGKSYATAQGVSRHKTEAHKENATVKCSRCGKDFGTRKDNMQRHENKCVLKQLANIEPKEHKCNECKTVFASNFSLDRHKLVCKKKPKKVKRLFVPTMLPENSIPDHPKRSFSTFEMMVLYGMIGLNVIEEHMGARKEIPLEQNENNNCQDIDFSIESAADTPSTHIPLNFNDVSSSEDQPSFTSREQVSDSNSKISLSTPAIAYSSSATFPSTPVSLDSTIQSLQSSSKSATDQRKLHRAYNETANIIKKYLQKLPEEYHRKYLEKSLVKAGAQNLIITSQHCKQRGITRIADYAINMVWKYWKGQSTVSNACTSRPATVPVTAFETDPLLSHVDISNEHFVTHTTKRGHTRYEHPYMVQNTTDLEIYQKFISEHSISIGRSSFQKLKPFFIRQYKESDIETCCCIYHVNFRNGFEALSRSFKDCKFTSSDVVEQVGNIIKTYDSYKSYIFKFCKRDELNILCLECESGDCGHWIALYDVLAAKISDIVREHNITKKYSFTRFMYQKTEDYGNKLKPDTTPLSLDEICLYIRSKLATFVKHSNQHFRDCLLWKILKLYTTSNGSALIIIDFSENLSIPVQNEPQSMYWVRKQVSIMNGISETFEKTYYGHFSESRLHDQVYTKESLVSIIRSIPGHDHYVIRSDNATHFKCGQCFFYLQEISNECLATIVRIYGVSGHGKGEIDSVGGHIKNAIRKKIMAGDYILDTDDCLAALIDKFGSYENPKYVFEKIEAEVLMKQRNEVIKYEFKTVPGTSEFHMLVFKPFKKYFIASKVLCACDKCLDRNYEECSNFNEYYPEVSIYTKPLTRSEKVCIDEEESSPVSIMGGMVTKDCIFAVKADSSTQDYFLVLCKEIQTTYEGKNPLEDAFGHQVFCGDLYITGVYLEISDYGRSCTNYSEVFLLSGTVFFPQVPMKKKKNGMYSLNNDMVVELNIRSSMNTTD